MLNGNRDYMKNFPSILRTQEILEYENSSVGQYSFV